MSNPTTPLVHTPYNANYDMVPYGSEEAICEPAPETNFNSSCGHSLTNDSEAGDAEVTTNAQHTFLQGQSEFLELPTNGSGRIDQVPASSRLFRLFIGHIRFETTPSELRWIIFMLTGVTCGKIETRGLGCFMVFFANYDEMWRVKGLHKRALFDHTGVWFARNESQEKALTNYVSQYVPQLQNCRLPKGLMVVDEETSRKRHKKNKGSKDAAKAATTGPTSSAIVPPAPIAQAPVPVPVPMAQPQSLYHFTTPIATAQQFWNVSQPLF